MLEKIYLLAKSIFNITYKNYDIEMAKTLTGGDWLFMIANLKSENVLPEVWADFYYDLFNK